MTIIQKGPEDVIAVHPSSPDSEPQRGVVDTPGGLKRCGGQGDILSGAAGTFLAWGKCYEDGAWGRTPDQEGIPVSRIPFLGAVGASIVTRTTSRRGFRKMGRSLITADLIGEIGGAFEEVFGEEANKGKL